MGRCPRIEYEGAVYHVMSRGNRQEPVFRTDRDHEVFLDTLGEACDRCGWRVHAFVLMGNHYHLLIETPEANLVDGMRRLQGTYTKRFNLRHQLWGHLFQGRYKALVVDPAGDYFSTVASYIHLNPARAKCFDLEKGCLEDYAWSSYPLYMNPSRRPEWLRVERTLGNLGLSDDRAGLKEYSRIMQKRVLEIACSANPGEVDERWALIRKGWAFGGDNFRSQLQEVLDGVMDGNRRESYSGEPVKKHDEREAERLLAEGLRRLKVDDADLALLKKGDNRKKVVAWIIRKKTSVKNEWIVQRLHMGRASNLSRYVKDVDEAKEGELWELNEMMK
ncbi:transposase [Pontiella agarivorans]|uniref:Transposase n=1 Tax=Pontiella agarivorans TaxID=3038953 RepID=A0ABU5MX27_9BACT|nr:transposase [Pontiella agarivorans]MDZ8118760.1 transposase [Pontiella agarivorans]